MSSEEKNAKCCSLVQDMLSAYLDGELSVQDAALVSAHLKECDGCREEFVWLQQLHKDLTDMAEVPLPQGFAATLHERLLSEAVMKETLQDTNVVELPAIGKQDRRFWQRSWFPRSIAAAMVLCVGLTMAGIMKHDSKLPVNGQAPMVASTDVAPQDVAPSVIGPLDNGIDQGQAGAMPEVAQDGVATESTPKSTGQQKLFSGLPARKQEDSVWLASRKESLQQPEEAAAADESMVMADTAEPLMAGRAAAPMNISVTNTLVISSQDAVASQQQVAQLLDNYHSANYTAGNVAVAKDTVTDDATENAQENVVDEEKGKQNQPASGGGSGSKDANIGSSDSGTEAAIKFVEYEISKQDMERFLETANSNLSVVSQALQEGLDDIDDEETVLLRIEFQS